MFAQQKFFACNVHKFPTSKGKEIISTVMAGFFLKGGKNRKRKNAGKTPIAVRQKKKSKEVVSDNDDSDLSGAEELESNQSESEDETAQEKRLRLAKEYISKLEHEETDKQLDKDIDKEAIAHRLQEDVLEDAGHLEKFIADTIKPNMENIKILRGHQLPVTCVVVSHDNKYIFSASKDGTIIKWDVTSGVKLGKILNKAKTKDPKSECHSGQVLCLALTTDFKFLASGGQDMLVLIWNPDTLAWLHTFKGHRDNISGLAFQHRKHQLFSASNDKTIKVWSLDEMAYVETLYGHEDAVLGIDSLYRDHAVSCGGRDRSVHLWKIPEESQLVFQSSKGSSFDCITMLNEEYFLTGGDDGSLSVFFVRKKKPITLRMNAHQKKSESPRTCCDESWITAVTCLPYTDLVASGSCDGCIKLWRCEKSFRAVKEIHSIPMLGFVNSLKFSSNGDFLVAGVGQEHRLGRWWKIKEARNSICIIPLDKISSEEKINRQQTGDKKNNNNNNT
ncbi:U3 small nucleolar RNA-interacting protein 2-like isoform X2 [Hydractinia symbiolongicarpus]|uniref:U3 small nucleolar RNA-interacting protein 2-like isoform X2 n=1 Tax=Hydractinia symbiolongicarpus TaxID=13093 RepID=UPI00255085C2|nr:U3 small nucleolar RNA-interacting protein 2-like isoform X2 [Hydractinia symbiolongicarpus]